MYELVLVGPVTGNSRLIMIVSSSQHVPTPTRGEIYDDELGLALLHEGRPLVLRFDELHVFDGSWGEFFYELVGKFLHVLSNNRALLLCLHLLAAAGTPSSISIYLAHRRISRRLASAPPAAAALEHSSSSIHIFILLVVPISRFRCDGRGLGGGWCCSRVFGLDLPLPTGSR